MTIFYWTMAGLTAATMLPSLIYVLLYATTGEEACARRAKILFSAARLFALLGFNIGIWGHVAVAIFRRSAPCDTGHSARPALALRRRLSSYNKASAEANIWSRLVASLT